MVEIEVEFGTSFHANVKRGTRLPADRESIRFARACSGPSGLNWLAVTPRHVLGTSKKSYHTVKNYNPLRWHESTSVRALTCVHQTRT